MNTFLDGIFKNGIPSGKLHRTNLSDRISRGRFIPNLFLDISRNKILAMNLEISDSNEISRIVVDEN